MKILEQALASRIPFVHLVTDDILFHEKILSHIVGEDVRYFDPKNVAGSDAIAGLDGTYFWTSAEGLSVPHVYHLFRAAKKVLVFVNTKTSVLYLETGLLIAPRAMVIALLTDTTGDAAQAEALVTAFGGMTLKEARDTIAITQKREGALTHADLNKTRNLYVSRLRGLTQISTEYDYYDCPSTLQEYLSKNLPFFLKPVHKDLVPRGLLFDGPPGTGKTMGAKAIAKALGLPLFRLDIAGMKDKYVGNSESNLAAALKQVDEMAPCVVLIDEVEKLFGATLDSGVTSSMLGSILWWMQEHTTQVFTLLTTNKKSAIPPELYRRGRIDQVLNFTGIHSVESARKFAKNVYETLAAALDHPIPFAQLQGELMDIVEAQMAGDNGAITQSFLSEMVHEAIKTSIVLEAQKDEAL